MPKKGQQRKVPATSSNGKGDLLYEEKVARGLRPNRLTSGWKWNLWEDLGRALWVGLVVYSIFYFASVDLSSRDHAITFVLALAGIVAVFYMTEIRGPQVRRESTPIRIYSSGVEMYASSIERLIGRKAFTPKEDIAKVEVVSMSMIQKGQVVKLPSKLIFHLTSGKKIKTSRRRPQEIQAMVKILEDELKITNA